MTDHPGERDPLGDAAISELRAAFARFEKGGSIASKDLKGVMSALGHEVTDGQFDTILAGMRAGRRIEFAEFESYARKLAEAASSEGKILQAFQVLDFQGNGFISAAQLRQIVTHLDIKLTDAEVDEIIREADVDGDSQINFEEFLKVMMAK